MFDFCRKRLASRYKTHFQYCIHCAERCRACAARLESNKYWSLLCMCQSSSRTNTNMQVDGVTSIIRLITLVNRKCFGSLWESERLVDVVLLWTSIATQAHGAIGRPRAKLRISVFKVAALTIRLCLNVRFVKAYWWCTTPTSPLFRERTTLEQIGLNISHLAFWCHK